MRQSRVFICANCSFGTFKSDEAALHNAETTHNVKVYHKDVAIPLRKCTICQVEANTKAELDKFVKNAHSLHFRENLCKKCAVVLKSEYIKGQIYNKK